MVAVLKVDSVLASRSGLFRGWLHDTIPRSFDGHRHETSTRDQIDVILK